MWLTNEIDGGRLSHFEITKIRDLVENLTKIRDDFNLILSETGRNDEFLDDREIQLALYKGQGDYYLRHKDAFRLDQNNIESGQKMRKITVIAYLNPDLDNVKAPKGQKGELRLYL